MEIRLVPGFEPNGTNFSHQTNRSCKHSGKKQVPRSLAEGKKKDYQPVQFSVQILGMPVLFGNQLWQ
jgi:hypothetical protein